MSQILNGEFLRNETNQNSMGGTERMTMQLAEKINAISEDVLKQVQIVSSRVRELDESKIRIFWAHDLPGDPESEFLRDINKRNKFHKFVFVSNWQMQGYMQTYGIPWSKCVVIQNAIDPIEEHEKPDPKDGLNFIYTPTPHRGLGLLVPVFEQLAEKHKDIHLDVFSSFKLYGWEERDVQYKELFDKIEQHPNMTNHGTVSNEEVRTALKKAHVFAYPSIWAETSCMCLMEAMSAGLVCVHSNYAALPETAANWTTMYQLHENANSHAGVLFNVLNNLIENYKGMQFQNKLGPMKAYADAFYSWEYRPYEWIALIQALAHDIKNTEFEKEVFRYTS